MAQHFTPPDVDQGTPPDPFAIALTKPSIGDGTDDSEEWEYEYSATETDTHYLTLDLTVPDLPKKRLPKPGANTKARWLNPGLGRHKRHGLGAAPTYKPMEAGETQDKEVPTQLELEQEEEDEDEGVVSPTTHGATGGVATPQQPKEEEKAPNIQILDLHTDNPFVSYEGRIFSCTWAENIGTELIFTKHNSENPLPSLRTLPGNVDLLAASSARLISRPLRVEHKSKRADAELKTQLERPSDFAINVGVRAGPKRRDQARFLERLIEIKESKGEEDMVTIFSQKRKTNDMWKKQLRQQREEERKELGKALREGDKAQAEEARRRLAEMSREDEGLQAQEVQNIGSKRKRVPGKQKSTASTAGGNGDGRPVNRQGRKKKSGLGLFEDPPRKPTSGPSTRTTSRTSVPKPQPKGLNDEDEGGEIMDGTVDTVYEEGGAYEEATGDEMGVDDAEVDADELYD